VSKKNVAAPATVAGKASGADLGPPVLLMGEDESEYNRLLAQVAAAVGPTDVIEEFWVRDVVDLELRPRVLQRFGCMMGQGVKERYDAVTAVRRST
jgi:hypothetical protein